MKHDPMTHAVELFRRATRMVALTGAGISTPSGIPDFRSDGGLWERDNPLEVASLSGFQRDPQRFFRWLRPLLDSLLKAQPNPAHHALADLERRGLLRAVITQNIDGLHQQAGSREVYELHGHLRSATCPVCGHQVPAQHVIEHVLRDRLARCQCGGAFKPDVVLFEEMLPTGLYWLATRALHQADLVLIAGSALQVYPVADLPLQAVERGARLVIINQSETQLDRHADLVIRGDVAQVLPHIVRQL